MSKALKDKDSNISASSFAEYGGTRFHEQFFNRIIEIVPTSLYLFDIKSSRNTFLTSPAAGMLGYSLEEIKVFSDDFLNQFMHPDDIERVGEHFRRLRDSADNVVYEFEYRMRHKSGEWRWFRSSDRVFRRDENGIPIEILGIAFDITDVKRAQQEKSKLAAIVTDSNHAIISKDLEGVITGWNKSAERIFGYSAAEAIGQSITLIVPDDLWEEEQSILKRLRCGEAVDHYETVRCRKDGGKIHVSVSVSPIRNERGEIIGASKIAQDITVQKRIEEETRQDEKRFIQIANGLPQLVWTCEPDGTCDFLSRQWLDFTGVPEKEQLGFGWLEQLHPDDRQPTIDAWNKAVAQDEAFQTEFRIRRYDGVYRIFDTRAVRLFDNEKKIIKWFGSNTDITERKQAEEQLQKRNEQLNVLARISKLLIVGNHSESDLLETVFKEVCLTVGAEIYVNYQPDDAVSMKLNTWGGLTDDERGLFDRVHYGEMLCGRVAERREPIIVEDIPNNTVEGSEAARSLDYGAYAGFPLIAGERLLGTIAFVKRREKRFADGEVQLIQTVCDQIAATLERRRLLDDLRASHETFRHLVQNSPFGVYVIDADFRLAQVSAGAKKVFENVQPLIGRDFAEILRMIWQEPFATDTVNVFRHTLRTGEPFHAPTTIEKRGDIDAVEAYDWKIERLTMPDGRFGVVCHFYDLSERQRYEAELRISEERFRLASDAAVTLVYDVDLTGRRSVIVYGLERVTGYRNDDSDLSSQWWHSLIHPDDLPAHVENYTRHLETGGTYRAVYRIRRKDGAWIWVEDTAQIIEDENGDPVQIVGAIVDITERKQAESEREEFLQREQILRREAEKANHTKDEFLAVVSHELRTPLNAILGWSTMAQTDDSDTETIKRALKVIERSARNQNHLISDILDVSRIITGKLQLNVQPVRLAEIVRAAIDTVRLSVSAKKISLEAFIEPDESIKFDGDADRLQQIVWNLLSNAVKFTPENGKIKISLKYRDGNAEIVVSDTGEGIEPHILPFVFDRFRQADAKKNRIHGGLGLGLSIVRHLTEMHGGRASVVSDGSGMGATFTIRLPLNTETDRAGGEKHPVSEQIPPTAPAKPTRTRLLESRKILVVDDDVDALELARFILSVEGAEVLTVRSVDEALECFDRETNFAAIITDIGMPENDGFVLLRELQTRFQNRKSSVPIVALTAYAGEQDRTQILETGFSTYLAKPFESVELVKMVAKLIFDNR